MVVVGTTSVTQGRSWQSPALRGNAALVEAGISWLTAQPQIIDVPAKPSVMAGMRLTDEGFAEVRNYVVIYMPVSIALLGIAVFLRRRSTERRRSTRAEAKRDASENAQRAADASKRDDAKSANDDKNDDKNDDEGSAR